MDGHAAIELGALVAQGQVAGSPVCLEPLHCKKRFKADTCAGVLICNRKMILGNRL